MDEKVILTGLQAITAMNGGKMVKSQDDSFFIYKIESN